MPHSRLSRLVPALFVLASLVHAQPTVIAPLIATPLASIPLTLGARSLAVDRFGNVYVLDAPSSSPVFPPATVHRVRPDGTVDLGHVPSLGSAQQLATNPQDGLVYLAEWFPILPVFLSTIQRVEPSGGLTSVLTAPVVATGGFTIDNQGRFLFGGTVVNGGGLVRHDPSTGTTTVLSPGFGSNSSLLALSQGGVLTAEGASVKRWSPGTGVVAYYDAPMSLPNQVHTITSLARNPFNTFGTGALIGVREFTTICLCGSGTGRFANNTGGNGIDLATEGFGALDLGFGLFASGPGRDAYWLSIQGGGGGTPLTGLLYRLTEVPTAGLPGSLTASTGGGVALRLDLFGPPSVQFTLGAGLQGSVDPLFVPGSGLLDLNPFDLDYVAVLDGVGLLGPPQPSGMTDAAGVFTLNIPFLPPPAGITVDLQFLMYGTGVAPNTSFYISNVLSLAL